MSKQNLEDRLAILADPYGFLLYENNRSIILPKEKSDIELLFKHFTNQRTPILVTDLLRETQTENAVSIDLESLYLWIPKDNNHVDTEISKSQFINMEAIGKRTYNKESLNLYTNWAQETYNQLHSIVLAGKLSLNLPKYKNDLLSITTKKDLNQWIKKIGGTKKLNQLLKSKKHNESVNIDRLRLEASHLMTSLFPFHLNPSRFSQVNSKLGEWVKRLDIKLDQSWLSKDGIGTKLAFGVFVSALKNEFNYDEVFLKKWALEREDLLSQILDRENNNTNSTRKNGTFELRQLGINQEDWIISLRLVDEYISLRETNKTKTIKTMAQSSHFWTFALLDTEVENQPHLVCGMVQCAECTNTNEEKILLQTEFHGNGVFSNLHNTRIGGLEITANNTAQIAESIHSTFSKQGFKKHYVISAFDLSEHGYEEINPKNTNLVNLDNINENIYQEFSKNKNMNKVTVNEKKFWVKNF